MSNVHALCVGADVLASPFRGEVEAVHNRAVTVRLEDGRRMSLLCEDIDHGMRIVSIASGAWARVKERLSLERRVQGDEYGLRTENLRIDWKEAPVWESPAVLPTPENESFAHGLRRARLFLGDMLERVAPNVLWTGAHRRFETLCRDLAAGVPIESDIARLIGAGPGLTPSGDDMLAGLMGGLHATGDERFIAVRDAVRRHDTRTSALSRDYLDQACRGWWTEKPLAVFRAIVRNDTALEGNMRLLATRGHTSGLDFTTGLLAGLSFAAGLSGPSFPGIFSKEPL